MTHSPDTFRVPSPARIDRTQPVEFVFDDVTYRGYAGDTLASALLANGVHTVSSSVNRGRVRGITGAWAEDATAQVGIDAPYREPMVPATTVEICPGLVAHGVPGWGKLSEPVDTARYDSLHHHPDVLVVGAGAAGLMAAVITARAGVPVLLIDERPEPGGVRPDAAWVAGAVAEFDAFPHATRLIRTTAFGAYDDGCVLAVERRTDHLAGAPATTSRQRIHRIRAGRIIVATGAHERPIVFAGNDIPGVMLAGAAADYLHRYGVLVGRTAVVFTAGDSAYGDAFDLAESGVTIAAIIDVREQVSDDLRRRAAELGIDIRADDAVVTALEQPNRPHVGAVELRDGTVVAGDTVLVSGGWNPAAHLWSQLRGTIAFDASAAAFLPAGTLPNVDIAGAAAGLLTPGSCLTDGRRAGLVALRALGALLPEYRGVPRTADRAPAATAVYWRVPEADEELSFVDLQRDATVADVSRAVGAGMSSVEHVKRYTTIGTAHDQGKTSGIVTSGIVAEVLGIDVADAGTTTFRPPYTPVSFAALAGRHRGDLYDPIRRTPLHEWHVERGAVFEDVGQWQRPRFYPRGGEDMESAVLRECAAVRSGVGILDGSTLGVIDVAGPDAPAFLDMLYTNLMSTLTVGKIRYGVMCGPDGMVKDDGTVMRVANDRYTVYTTTGNATAILDWMEEWHQTEWPHLTVFTTSLTDHVATFPVVGPRSRDVIGAVFPDLEVANEAFGFMDWRDTTFGGVPVRLGRVSFSGELAYEVNVAAEYADAVWRALIDAGTPFGITPYGTESMHVLRAEKGYPIIGQDTDGTVSPHDLGMGWVVSKRKPDFIGKRSFSRPANQNPQRKQFVGLLPTDGTTKLPEGSQIIAHHADRSIPAPPVPMLGHVTSSYRSAELDRPFALALVAGGHQRIGTLLDVPVGDRLIEVEVTTTVFVDPEGARRDG